MLTGECYTPDLILLSDCGSAHNKLLIKHIISFCNNDRLELDLKLVIATYKLLLSAHL